MSSLQERLGEPGPKRILALDGGGIRGVITLGFLERIEAALRQRHGRPEMVLRDYFDLVGGTSTGAIIAAFVALGWPVADIQRLYLELGRTAFQPMKSWLGAIGRLLGAKFDERPLENLLRTHFGERRLDDADLGIGLVVVVKRADTSSVWPLNNLPCHRFFEHNRGLTLWRVVRASTAAPTYFRPSYISDVGGGEAGVFVDGGVSMHNNPALQLLMVANLAGFGLGWPLGEERLLVCSIGTGDFNSAVPLAESRSARFNNLSWLAYLTAQMIEDASELDRTILQWISRSPTAQKIDLQIGDLAEDGLGPAPLISYLRYDVALEASDLRAVGVEMSDAEAVALREMSRAENLAQLDAVGRAAGAARVRADHFAPCFDRLPPTAG